MYGDVMRTQKQVQMEEDRLVELAERIRLIHEYPTCLYVGEELPIRMVYNEEVEPKWDDNAQEIIEILKKQGRKACCTHKGKFHLLYY
jgi:hypothetical protein